MNGLFRSILGFYRYMRIWVFLRIGLVSAPLLNVAVTLCFLPRGKV